jgi:D-3-phosphoglycerate dehydrogenase
MKVYSLTKTLDDFVDFYIDDSAEAEVIVVGGSKIELEKYPKLKYIFKCGVGVDNIPELEGTGVELVIPSEETKECIFNEVSDFTMYSILNAHFRDNGNMDGWKKVERPQFSNRKSLVVGVGNIGKRIYKKLSELTYTTSYDLLAISVWESLEQAVKKSDIVTLHCPLTKYNKGMIKTEWLKEDVILVNTARAELVDEDALYDFLKNNPKATAAFDVFWEEPYKGKLLELENFIATPHVASFGDGFKKGLYRDLLELLEKK